jgi:hypothetical protein
VSGDVATNDMYNDRQFSSAVVSLKSGRPWLHDSRLGRTWTITALKQRHRSMSAFDAAEESALMKLSIGRVKMTYKRPAQKDFILRESRKL